LEGCVLSFNCCRELAHVYPPNLIDTYLSGLCLCSPTIKQRYTSSSVLSFKGHVNTISACVSRRFSEIKLRELCSKPDKSIFFIIDSGRNALKNSTAISLSLTTHPVG